MDRQPNMYEEVVNFKAIKKALSESKKKILVSALMFTSAVIIITFFIPNTYTASALLKATSQPNSNNFGSFNALANLANINIPGQVSSDDSELAIEIIKSKKFFLKFIENRGIILDLAAAKSWNPSNHSINYDKKLFEKYSKPTNQNNNLLNSQQNDILKLHKKFIKNLEITRNRKTDFITIKLSHLSPNVAKLWLDWIIYDVNQDISNMRIQEAKNAIAFLNDEVAMTPFAELKNLLYTLIKEYKSTVMLANIRSEYAITTIDPAVLPNDHSSPNRPLIIFIAFLLSLTTSALLAVFKYYKQYL